MPAGQPFTRLCAALAPRPEGADLHIHTTASDGLYSPEDVIDLARRSGLRAVAITDHDTTASVAAATNAGRGRGIEVVPGVEITAEWQGREIHLLAYFVSLDDAPLQDALARVRLGRRERFGEMLRRLRAVGVSVEDDGLAPESVGRRNLAELLVRQGHAGSVREAFHRWLRDGGAADVPKVRLPAEEALRLARQAGGVASWAHPGYDNVRRDLPALAASGLGAIEAAYPDVRPAVVRELRAMAKAQGLAVTGGSDCHGSGKREIGACTTTDAELEQLRSLSRRPDVSLADRLVQEGPE